MAALGLAEFDRSGHRQFIRAVLEQATIPDEIVISGIALLRLSNDVCVLPRLEGALVQPGPMAPATFGHTVPSEHGGTAGADLAIVLSWVRSAAEPLVTGPELSSRS